MMHSNLKSQNFEQTASNDDATTAQSQAALPVELLEHIIRFLPAFENLPLREVSNLFCSIWETVAKEQLPTTIPTIEQAEKFLHTKQQAEISYLTKNKSLILNERGSEKISNRLTLLLDRLKFLKEKTSFLASHVKEKCLNRLNNIIIRNRIAKTANNRGLYLSCYFLTRFPEELFSDTALNTFWTNLEVLYLNNNQLATLPDAIGKCVKLQNLDVHNNQLTTLPDTIGKCVALEWLDVNCNELSTLPEALGRCSMLWGLYLNNNQLTTLPDAIGKCVALRELFIENNELTTLPDSIEQCSQLVRLAITKNRLKQLPTNLPGNIIFFDERANVIDKIRCLELQKPTLVENEETEETEEPAPKRRRR